MHVATIRRQHKDRVYETHLLRRSYRENGKVRNETLANLTSLPDEVLELVRRGLKGDRFVPAHEALAIERSLPHGAVAAVAEVARLSGITEALGPRHRHRDVALGMLLSQVLEPDSKLAYTRSFADTTLGEDLDLLDASSDECYGAMDWLLSRKDDIEGALVARHLSEDSIVCYDLSSSYVEGIHNELAAYGYSRDQKRGKRQIEYGVVANTAGLPLAIEVFPGNTSDPASFTAALSSVRERFDLRHVVLVGDRGMITAARIAALKEIGGLDWVTALRAPQVKALAEDDGPLQLSLFDEVNFCEITHPDYPGERLVCCRNPALANERARKREALLSATEAELQKVSAQVEAGHLSDAAKIGLRVGRVVNRYKVQKHFHLEIEDGCFRFSRKADEIAREAALDGIYVLRTSCDTDRLSSAEVISTYKSLAGIERDFRSMKSIDLEIRPIRHRLADRVRAHAFLCLLGAHLVWNLRRSLAPLTFADEQQPVRDDPVARAERSPAARRKAARRRSADGLAIHSFQGLLDHLGTLSRVTCTVPGTNHSYEQLSVPTPVQRRAFELLGANVPLHIA
jgi:Transposase DDE domain